MNTDVVRVLVVDDDAAIRGLLSMVLEEAGYEVLTAQDGGEALRYLGERQRRMVVLLDYSMPRVDGLAVLRAVAADPALSAHRAFVLITAVAGSLPHEAHVLMSRLGIGIMEKPFDLDRVIAVVGRAAQHIVTPPDSPGYSSLDP
jgi:two-component system chemotaxis response regulator CheY